MWRIPKFQDQNHHKCLKINKNVFNMINLRVSSIQFDFKDPFLKNWFIRGSWCFKSSASMVFAASKTMSVSQMNIKYFANFKMSNLSLLFHILTIGIWFNQKDNNICKNINTLNQIIYFDCIYEVYPGCTSNMQITWPCFNK